MILVSIFPISLIIHAYSTDEFALIIDLSLNLILRC